MIHHYEQGIRSNAMIGRWIVLFCFMIGGLHAQNTVAPPLDMNEEFVQKLNGIRLHGCSCGKPTTAVSRHPLLEKSAQNYARKIMREKHFDHIDLQGYGVGHRVDKVGYPWIKVGENLGKNQVDIDQLLTDWIKSRTHCELLMNPEFTEVGLGRQGKIWVLHMGRR